MAQAMLNERRGMMLGKLNVMKPIVLALAIPILLTGCAGSYYGYDDYGPGYPPITTGTIMVVPYIGFYGYDRGYYHHGYRHYTLA